MKKKPTAIDKAIILLKDIRKNASGRTLALSKKYKLHKATVSRILIILAKKNFLKKMSMGVLALTKSNV